MQRKKTRLSESYRNQQNSLQANPDLLTVLAPEEREGLRQKFAHFRAILADNMLAIRAAHDATEKVVASSRTSKSAMELVTNAGRFTNRAAATRPITPPRVRTRQA